MRPLLPFLILFLLCFYTERSAAQQAPTDCSRFHTGTFVVTGSMTDRKFIVTRTKHFQVEQEEGSDEINKYRIHWVDDCDYTLTCYKVSPDIQKNYGKYKLVVNIIETDGNKYTCRMQFDQPGFPVIDAHLEKIK